MSESENESYLSWTDRNVQLRKDFFSKLNTEKIAQELSELHPLKVQKRSLNKQRQPYRAPGKQSKFERALMSCFSPSTTDTIPVETGDIRYCGVKFSSPVDFVPTCSAIHSSECKLLFVVGYENGRIILSVDDSRKSYVAHSSCFVTGVGFFCFGFYSAGLDGTLQKYDLLHSVKTPELVCHSVTRTSFSSMVVSEIGHIWLGQSDGKLLHVDGRDKSASYYTVSRFGLNSVSHSFSENVVCISSYFVNRSVNDSGISLWDIRMLSSNFDSKLAKPISEAYLTYPVESVECSFLDTNLILCNGSDDVTRVFKYEHGFGHLKLVAAFSESDSKFKPIWHPQINKTILVGNEKEQLLIRYCGEEDSCFGKRRVINSKPVGKNHILAHHPHLPYIVGANYESFEISVISLE